MAAKKTGKQDSSKEIIKESLYDKDVTKEKDKVVKHSTSTTGSTGARGPAKKRKK